MAIVRMKIRCDASEFLIMPVTLQHIPNQKNKWANDCQTGRFQQAWTFYEDMLNSNISAGFSCVALRGAIKSFSVANSL